MNRGFKLPLYTSYSFDSKNRLKSHVTVVHEQQDQHVCHICAKQYRSKQSLHLHLKEHSGEPRSCCQICGRSYKNEQYVRKHIKTVHEKVAQVPMQCPHCSKISPNRKALAKHIRFIHNFTIHKCPLCDKEFKRPVGLKVGHQVTTLLGEQPQLIQMFCLHQIGTHGNAYWRGFVHLCLLSEKI